MLIECSLGAQDVIYYVIYPDYFNLHSNPRKQELLLSSLYVWGLWNRLGYLKNKRCK